MVTGFLSLRLIVTTSTFFLFEVAIAETSDLSNRKYCATVIKSILKKALAEPTYIGIVNNRNRRAYGLLLLFFGGKWIMWCTWEKSNGYSQELQQGMACVYCTTCVHAYSRQ